MVQSPEMALTEKPGSREAVRHQLADHLRNYYTSTDPLADVLAVNAARDILVVRFARGDSGKSVSILEDQDLNRFLIETCSSHKIDSLCGSSSRFDPGDQWPAGMRSIYKKVNHSQAQRQRGDQVSSAFDKYRYLRFANATIPEVQSEAESLIRNIMLYPSTVIERDHNIDIFNDKGQGIRLRKDGGESFCGFLDSGCYFKPMTEQKKMRVKVRTSEESAA